MVNITVLPYKDQETLLEGWIAHPPEEKKHPVVILCHGWSGRDAFICEKAKTLAEWGYVGFALDMYGKGVLGKSKAENASLKKPFMTDRHLLQKRVLKAFEVICAQPYADSSRVAALGFGFGGTCALDLARSGADLKGVISVYGHFDPPPQLIQKPIRAKILALHGYQDPIVSLKELCAFEKEMNDSQVDWQIHLYGNATHAFACPSASDPESGIIYNPLSAKRAWQAIQNFLGEVL